MGLVVSSPQLFLHRLGNTYAVFSGFLQRVAVALLDGQNSGPAALRFVGPEPTNAPTSHSPPLPSLPSLATSEPPPPTPLSIPRHCGTRPRPYVRVRNTSPTLGLVVGRELSGGAVVGMDEGQRAGSKEEVTPMSTTGLELTSKARYRVGRCDRRHPSLSHDGSPHEGSTSHCRRCKEEDMRANGRPPCGCLRSAPPPLHHATMVVGATPPPVHAHLRRARKPSKF
jgi:hypothetical protein